MGQNDAGGIKIFKRRLSVGAQRSQAGVDFKTGLINSMSVRAEKMVLVPVVSVFRLVNRQIENRLLDGRMVGLQSAAQKSPGCKQDGIGPDISFMFGSTYIH